MSKYPPYQVNKPINRLHYEIHIDGWDDNKPWQAVQFEPVFKHNNQPDSFTGYFHATIIGNYESMAAAETAIDMINGKY